MYFSSYFYVHIIIIIIYFPVWLILSGNCSWNCLQVHWEHWRITTHIPVKYTYVADKAGSVTVINESDSLMSVSSDTPSSNKSSHTYGKVLVFNEAHRDICHFLKLQCDFYNVLLFESYLWVLAWKSMPENLAYIKTLHYRNFVTFCRNVF